MFLYINNLNLKTMKKLMILAAGAAFMLATATTSFAGDQNGKCDKDKKACCKNGGAKACAKSDAKSCDKDKETKAKAETKEKAK